MTKLTGLYNGAVYILSRWTFKLAYGLRSARFRRTYVWASYESF